MTKNRTAFTTKILMSIFSILILAMFLLISFKTSNEGTAWDIDNFWKSTFKTTGLPVVGVVALFFLIYIIMFIFEEVKNKRQNEKENILFGILLLAYLSVGIVYGIYWIEFYVYFGIYLQFLLVGIYLMLPPVVCLSHYFYKKRH